MITLAVLGFEGAVVRRAADATSAPIALRGVAATLAELRRRGVRVALVGEGGAHDVARALAAMGWAASAGAAAGPVLFDAVVAADEVLAPPPAPFAVHHAMESTGTLDVRQVLVAGDSLALLEAGRAAGAGWVIGVLSGAARRPELEGGPHDAILSDVNDLIALAVPAAPAR
ncbi:HAD family hydrolase [Agromyces aurantiacus]|uniref:HAD family hydrolase n=1 Tax=Agromyces aurantiacus TaxID=165814 RepID=A0ABV9R105_9MICO|nr:HAD family hydrolase [Agromyces aurantiacus]MBM7506080.1 phosphoglycolate phosphatase-like HAD superfamily hydrolase [Agromyces aurantiacus]